MVTRAAATNLHQPLNDRSFDRRLRKGFDSRVRSRKTLEELAVDDRGRYDARGPDGSEGLLEAERFARRFGPVTGARDHVVELRFADDIAGPVAGLTQIQELFESDQLALRV